MQLVEVRPARSDPVRWAARTPGEAPRWWSEAEVGDDVWSFGCSYPV